MSMLSDWKEKAEATKRIQEVRHPIVDLEADRNVRDAYFLGLVFAALANDYKIDDKERARLDEIGISLGLGDKADIEQAIVSVEDASDKKLLIEECARQIADPQIAEHFLSEFSSIWALGGGSSSEYEEFHKQLIAWMVVEIGEKSPSPETRQAGRAEHDKPSKPVKQLSEQDKLFKSLNKIADDYSSRRTISLPALKAISRRVGRFDPERINWPGAVNAILKEVM